MTTTITITVDLNDLVGLNRATDLFTNLANDAGLYADAKKTPDKDGVVVNAADKFGKVENPNKTEGTPPPPGGDGTTSTLVDLDKDKLPWDGRIHGEKKLKTTKGFWKKIKNIEKNEPGLVAKVEAELRAVMAAYPVETESSATEDEATQTPPPPPADSNPPPPPIESILIPEYLVDGKLYTADQLRASGWNDGQINKLPPHETSETADTSTTAITFPEFMGKVTAALADGTLTQVQVDTALAAEKLASFPLLSARQDLVPKIYAALFPNG